uniref:Uncharacterized protein AlNc14C92G5745 n=1 Tax=Albugo laibachii Nc14 TaxID=890382 RepID=F0WGL7_9STRA|nr:conserved hypothetical protein [Albugo laibachii Nc14]|eukprot:CCA20381.1 conserved hypothetical protein [Albugo laibachii Nc14]
MSFLDRFQDKISTVTAHGHLRKADGSEEVRVGQPIRCKVKIVKEPVYKKSSTHSDVSRVASTASSSLSTTRSDAESKRPVIPEPSRTHRSANYEPCTVSQYRKEKSDGYFELGKLQPDLYTDQLVQKRANNQRIREFSRSLREQNKTQIKSVREEHPASKSVSAREKAMEFAKTIPKPKPKSDTAPSEKGSVSYSPEISEEEETIEALQQRHQMSRVHVEAVMGKR